MVLVVKNLPDSAGRHKRHEFHPRVKKIPWRRKWQPTPVFLPEESHGQRSLATMVHGTTESCTAERLSTPSLYMSLRVSVYICVFVYMHMCLCVYVYICVFVYMHMCVCVCACVYLCVYAYECLCVYVYICVYIRI